MSKPQFLTPLRAEQINRWEWKLLTDLIYIHRDDQMFYCRKDSVTNFASVKAIRTFGARLLVLGLLLAAAPQLAGLMSIWVPQVLQPFMLLASIVSLIVYSAVVGYGNAASALHDELYREGVLPRAYCDDVYFYALRAEGVALWRASAMYIGVRLGGAKHYGSE